MASFGSNRCPRCGRGITGYPALSRHENYEICDICGIEEAMLDFIKSEPKPFSEWDINKEENEVKSKVIVVKPNVGLVEEFVEVDNEDMTVNWKELSRLLDGGYIEHCTFSKKLYDNKIDMWVDDSGKVKGLDIGVVIINKCSGNVVEILAGNVVFTSFDNMGNTYPLNEEQIKIVKDNLRLSLFDTECGLKKIITLEV